MGTVVSNDSIEGGTNKENVQDDMNHTCDNDVVEEDTDDAQGSTCDNTPVLTDRVLLLRAGGQSGWRPTE